jgi:hypothetical protein
MSQSLFDLQHKQFEQYFQTHKDRPWSEWLIIPKSRPKVDDEDDDSKRKNPNASPLDGKQGFVGVLQHPHNKSLTCLYKISKVDDNLVEHEYRMLQGLAPLAQYCPHFHGVYGIVPFDSNVHYEEDCPLEYSTKSKVIRREMLLMQHIAHKYDFHDMIRDESIKNDLILTIFQQVLLCIHMMHAYRFTHYDLHTENIIIRNCHPNLHLLYLLDEHTERLVPTYGYVPNIIDYGFSYCDVQSNPLSCTLLHTQDGFTSERFDPYADLKLFFISTVYDIGKEDSRKKIASKLSNITRNIFSGMNVSWSSGWDRSKHVSPVRIVHELIRDYVKTSVLFNKSDLWFDTLQQLIELPLSPLPYHELEKACRGFIEEFVKFEERIVSKTLLNYIFRVLVKYVREYRQSYLKGGDEGMWALIEMKKHFLEEYTQLVNYHVPSIDYEKMVCSLLLMAECIEGLFYDYLEKRHAEKDQQYAIMRCKTPLEFCSVLEHNFPQLTALPKPLTHKHQIFIIDHVQRRSKTLILQKQDVQVIDRLKDPRLIARYLRNLYVASSEPVQ